MFGLMIVTCVLVGLLVGPATALLVVPQWHTAWPAGDASFCLYDSLFPLTLDVSDNLEASCRNYSLYSGSVLQLLDAETTPALRGLHLLSTEFMQRVLGLEYELTYSIGTIRRTLNIQWNFRPRSVSLHSPRVWVSSTNVALSSFSRYISQCFWNIALWSARETQRGHYFAPLRDRLPLGTVATVKSKMPLARVQCLLADEGSIPQDAPGVASSATTTNRLPVS